jgi:hypothetical protein
MDTNTLRAWRWIRSGDTGISSETIWSVMMGEPPPGRGGSIPYDPADFGRCHRLLALFPEWRHRLPEVEAHDPMWGPLVREWDALTALYLEELPTGEGRKLWARMQELEDEARILAGVDARGSA